MHHTAEDLYAHAVEDYEALRRLLPKFAAARVRIREADEISYRIRQFVTPGVRLTKGALRDNAVCALANKGCNTHAAVRTLTDAGNGDDAMVLTRVVMETAVTFAWIMIDQPYRLDLYCLSSRLFARRWTQIVSAHFSREPDLVATAAAALTPEDLAVVRAAFGNTEYRWARERRPNGTFHDFSLQTMLDELEKKDVSTAAKGFVYDVSYFMHSGHAHATTEGLRQFSTLPHQQFFTCELGLNNGDCTLALQGANTFLCWLLSNVCVYLGLRDLEAELDSWCEQLTARAIQRTNSPPSS